MNGFRSWAVFFALVPEVVALVVLENMLPGAIRESDAKGTTPDAGKDKVLTFRIPPPSEWFK